MIKTKLTLTTLVLLLGVANLMARPTSMSYSCKPEPVHGMQYLESNTAYPSLERELGNNGYVVLSFDIDVIGNVSNIIVTQSGGANFDESAIKAVMNTDWNPAMNNGTATAVTFELPFAYHAK